MRVIKESKCFGVKQTRFERTSEMEVGVGNMDGKDVGGDNFSSREFEAEAGGRLIHPLARMDDLQGGTGGTGLWKGSGVQSEGGV